MNEICDTKNYKTKNERRKGQKKNKTDKLIITLQIK